MHLKRWNSAVIQSSLEAERESSGATTSYFNSLCLSHLGDCNKIPPPGELINNRGSHLLIHRLRLLTVSSSVEGAGELSGVSYIRAH